MSGAPSRLATLVGDSLGLISVIWIMPLVIILVGLPMALIVMGFRMVGRMIWP